MPWRSQIREHIADRVATLPPGARVLELGAGPGFVAQRALERPPNVATCTLMGFSDHMLALSRTRLAAVASAAFVLASFKSDDWIGRVDGRFDAVLSRQVVHELRRKRHAPRLYKQVHQVWNAGGLVLICDHAPFDDSAASMALYMTAQEQQQALTAAGFADVHVALSLNGPVLYAGAKVAGRCSTRA